MMKGPKFVRQQFLMNICAWRTLIQKHTFRMLVEYINCPAWVPRVKVFTKSGFSYDECPNMTLYVNPRPIAEAFSRYYQEAPSVEYWATTFYKETAEARREKLWKPKAEKINHIIKSFSKDTESVVVDIGGGYGIFAEDLIS